MKISTLLILSFLFLSCGPGDDYYMQRHTYYRYEFWIKTADVSEIITKAEYPDVPRTDLLNSNQYNASLSSINTTRLLLETSKRNYNLSMQLNFKESSLDVNRGEIHSTLNYGNMEVIEHNCSRLVQKHFEVQDPKYTSTYYSNYILVIDSVSIE